MFNNWHICYIVISILVTIGLLFAFQFVPFFKKEKGRAWILFTIGAFCFLTHISIFWGDFVDNTGGVRSNSSALFIIYPCNASMVCLVILGIMAVLNKKGVVFKWLAVGTAYLGVIGALITVFGEPYLSSAESWSSWMQVKSAFSHSFLLFGGLYLFTCKFFKIRLNNIIPIIAAGLVYGIIGLLDIWLFEAIDFSTNPMYILKPIKEDVGPLYGYVMFGIVILITAVFTMIWELFVYEHKNRFYKNFHIKELLNKENL
jgi:hypothetical protein